MSYFVTKYPAGTFSWADFFSTDIEVSKKFYTGLFGWTFEDMPTGEGKPDYTMFSLEGKYVAGGSPVFAPNMPSMWSSYVTVYDVDQATKQAQDLGAKVIMAPMDVLDSGRMSTIADPTGAVISLWQPKKHIGAGVVNTFGAMSWNELYTTDLEKSKDFYGKLFGWTFETDPTNGYTTASNNGRRNAGIFVITPEMGGMPPKWMVYFTVKNMEESVNKVKELSGIVWMQRDITIGKIAMVGDPTQMGFVLIQMNIDPTPWEE